MSMNEAWALKPRTKNSREDSDYLRSLLAEYNLDVVQYFANVKYSRKEIVGYKPPRAAPKNTLSIRFFLKHSEDQNFSLHTFVWLIYILAFFAFDLTSDFIQNEKLRTQTLIWSQSGHRSAKRKDTTHQKKTKTRGEGEFRTSLLVESDTESVTLTEFMSL